MSRCVFVGNIPYDATEAQLVQICEEIGPVISFRLVTDRETGKPKGYGFCEFKDEETALSARRNLSGYELGGRQLRVDFAENEKAGGGTGPERAKDQVRGGPASNQGPAGEQTVGYSAAAAAAGAMAGALGPQKGQNGAPAGQDGITQHLANMSKHQLYDVMCQMKALVLQDQQQARRLLIANPQLTKALFQAQIMLGMVHLPQGGQKPPLPPSSGPVGSQGFSVPPAAAPYPQQPTLLPQPPPLQRAPPPSMGHIPSSQLPPQTMGFQAPPPPPFPHQPQFGMNVPFQSQAQPPMPPQPPPQHPFQQQHPGMGLAGQGLGPPMGMDRGYQQPQQQKQPPYGMEAGPMPVYGQVQMPGPPQQLPLEIEHRNLLQQVMNLTPEQMSMLPPEQRQQVLQLQQAIQLQQMR